MAGMWYACFLLACLQPLVECRDLHHLESWLVLCMVRNKHGPCSSSASAEGSTCR